MISSNPEPLPWETPKLRPCEICKTMCRTGLCSEECKDRYWGPKRRTGKNKSLLEMQELLLSWAEEARSKKSPEPEATPEFAKDLFGISQTDPD